MGKKIRRLVMSTPSRGISRRFTVRISIRHRVIAAVFAVATASMTLLASPVSAAPATLPTLSAGHGGFAHQCVVAQDDGKYAAVVCADIVTGVSSDTTYYAAGQVEVYCQTVGNNPVIVGCNAAYAVAAMSSGAGVVGFNGIGSCGADAFAPNACAPGGQRNYFTDNSFSYSYSDAANCTKLNSKNQVYNVIEGYNGVQSFTRIELPDFTWVALSGGNDGQNQSSGHYFVCP